MTVPLHFVGEEECEGVKVDGGIVSHLMNDLDIVCLPADLPEYIEVDVTALHLGDSISLGEIKLPEGVESQLLNAGGDPAQLVVSISAPQVEVEVEEEVEEIAEGEVPTIADEEAAAAESEGEEE